jgi:Heterokaryon incompatibility protein (HET)
VELGLPAPEVTDASEVYLVPGDQKLRVYFKEGDGKDLLDCPEITIRILGKAGAPFHVIPAEIDVAELQTCIQGCLANHKMCNRVLHPESFRPGIFAAVRASARWALELVSQSQTLNDFFRAIDVHTLEVVDLGPRQGVEYTVLSHVWGPKGSCPVYNISNKLATPLIPGRRVRLPQPMPKTIRDSIKLTARLGVKYLWVDTLCIKQQDSMEKPVQIANMAAIYGNATLCIIAAAGDHANSGLPGIGRTLTSEHMNSWAISGPLIPSW